MRAISPLALDRLTKPWEEFVAYPYDDKVPKRRCADGRFRYPEYTGGPLRGTLTQGYGHTDAAGGRKIVLGVHWTEPEGAAVLAEDMAPCCATVERLVHVPLGQHQFDTLADFVFNAGAGTLRKSTLLKKLNAGDYDAVPAELLKFTYSKGEHMEGLLHRRQAEIALWRTPDDKPQAARVSPVDHGLDDPAVFCPKADLPPARSPLDSKSVAAGGTIVTTGLGLLAKGLDQVNDAAAPVVQVHDTLVGLGLWESLAAGVSVHPLVVGGAVVAVLGGFVLVDRWRHLHAEAR